MSRARGFTLIELLAAMAILAVVSVMAVQALNGLFQQRSVLGRVDDRAAQLIRGLALLRQDLEAIAPWDALQAPADPLPDTEASAALVQAADGVSFLRAGLAPLPGVPGTGLGHVRWALDQGQLTRRLRREAEGDDGAAVTVLDGVTSFGIAPLPAGTQTGASLAPGYEIRLVTEVWGDLRLVVVP